MKKQTYADINDLLENELLSKDEPETAELIQQLEHVKAKGYFTQQEFLDMCRWKARVHSAGTGQTQT